MILYSAKIVKEPENPLFSDSQNMATINDGKCIGRDFMLPQVVVTYLILFITGWQKIRHFTGTRKKAPQLHWVHPPAPSNVTTAHTSPTQTRFTNANTTHKCTLNIFWNSCYYVYTSLKIRKD